MTATAIQQPVFRPVETSRRRISIAESYATHWSAGSVKYVNAYTYYLLGKSIADLPKHAFGTLDQGSIAAIEDAIKSLKEFRIQEDDSLFHASREAAERIINDLNQIIEECLTQGAPFDPDAVTKIQGLGIFFTVTIARDLQNLPLFCVEKKGIYSLRALINGAGSEQSTIVKAKAPAMVISEINRSGVCLAYSCPTASAFHALRALELLATELIAKLGLPPAPLNRCNWGEYIQILRNGNAPKEITDLLQIIKDNYRNPIMHPDDTLDVEEATSLFGICQSAVEVICRHIP